MLPSFCHKRFQYCPVIILEAMLAIYHGRMGVEAAAEVIAGRYQASAMRRQHLQFYRQRIEENIELLEYGVRQVDASARIGKAGDKRERASIAISHINGPGKVQTFWRKVYVDREIAIMALNKKSS